LIRFEDLAAGFLLERSVLELRCGYLRFLDWLILKTFIFIPMSM